MSAWVVVPLDGTPHMLRSIEIQWMTGSQIDMAKREWDAAIAARPTGPEVPVCIDPQELQALRGLRDLVEAEVDKYVARYRALGSSYNEGASDAADAILSAIDAAIAQEKAG